MQHANHIKKGVQNICQTLTNANAIALRMTEADMVCLQRAWHRKKGGLNKINIYAYLKELPKGK